MHLPRLFICWFCAFSSVYAVNLLAVSAWVHLGYNNAYLVAAMMCPPLVSLFFGWLFFRPGFAKKISPRFAAAFIWIALNLFAGMALLAATEGIEPTEMFSLPSLIVESLNLLALLLAGYLAIRHDAASVGAVPPLTHSPAASPPSSGRPRQEPG